MQIQCGKVHIRNQSTSLSCNIKSFLTGGIIPYDGVPREEIVTVHPALPAVYINLGCTGIMFAIACLIFNFLCRNAK